jgi:hypothetical protein
VTSGAHPEQPIPAAIRNWWLAESDRREREEQRRLQAWRDGWNACEHALGDTYEAGFADGILALKQAQHDAYKLTEIEIARWGPRGREHFADPQPGDYTGGPVPPW